MTNLFRIAGVQMDVTFADPARNLQRIADHAQRAAADGAQLVVFPECAVTGYCFESLEEALPLGESIPGPATDALAEICQRENIFLVAGMLEREGDRLFNAAVLVGPDGVIGSYRKVHLPFLGVDRFTTPGDRPFEVHTAGEARVGILICYDLAFPEATRALALEGADLVVLPTNWPPGAECTADFVVNTRALENKIFFLAVNRVGTERGFEFIGRSKACDTHGNRIAYADAPTEMTIRAEIDLEDSRRKRIVRVPDKHIIDRFADRRPEMYARLQKG